MCEWCVCVTVFLCVIVFDLPMKLKSWRWFQGRRKLRNFLNMSLKKNFGFKNSFKFFSGILSFQSTSYTSTDLKYKRVKSYLSLKTSCLYFKKLKGTWVYTTYMVCFLEQRFSTQIAPQPVFWKTKFHDPQLRNFFCYFMWIKLFKVEKS